MKALETDVLIIGGGATGGGIAWDLALRGIRVILADMGDLATGTSGRYHGLLHSGGRYAVRDPESAEECILENRIFRKIIPSAVEDTGGYFVLCPGDDTAYVETWLKACANVGIETQSISLSQALKHEPALNPRLEAIYAVPDGSCDSWDLLHTLQYGAESTGKAQFLTYHRLDSFHLQANRVTGAQLTDLRTDEPVQVTCAVVVNAAGPWAAEVASKAGAHFNMRLSRGAMLAYNIRWVNTVINKLRAPGDGDIFVPVGTVSVIGTTSVPTDDPADTRVEAWEVTRILEEAEGMTPGISKARILRSWGGVRPLYDGGSSDGRNVKRTFTALDHAEAHGIEGLISVLGGKLTTFRLMAEKTADLVASKLNNTQPCLTATTVVPTPTHTKPHLHQLRGRLHALEKGETPGALICECELVTEPQIREALAREDVVSLNDLRRDLRLGMGPCQGGFCAYRATGIYHACKASTAHQSRALLHEFAERRFGGMKPLLWGHNLRQALLAEQLYGRVVGLIPNTLQHTPITPVTSSSTPSANGKKVVVVGAGLSGLTAALTALKSGARVEVVAFGQGSLTLHPGWIEVGDVEALTRQAHHPYSYAGKDALAHGLGILQEIVPLYPIYDAAVLASGTQRQIAFRVGNPQPHIIPETPILIVGVAGWREFFPELIRDALREAGCEADMIEVEIPHRGGNFDDWTIDIAHYLDTPTGLNHLAQQIKPHVGKAQVVALPSVIGFKQTTLAELNRLLGVPVLEIPTLTPSVPGLRLYQALRSAILAQGGQFTLGVKVIGLDVHNRVLKGIRAATVAGQRERIIPADAVILATGGLYSGGIESDYRGALQEQIANSAVNTLENRDQWFTHSLFEGVAQPIHRVGVSVQNTLRPLDASGNIIAENLFVAGRLLRSYSPVNEGSTEGVDIATGYQAAQHAIHLLTTHPTGA